MTRNQHIAIIVVMGLIVFVALLLTMLLGFNLDINVPYDKRDTAFAAYGIGGLVGLGGLIQAFATLESMHPKQ